MLCCVRRNYFLTLKAQGFHFVCVCVFCFATFREKRSLSVVILIRLWQEIFTKLFSHSLFCDSRTLLNKYSYEVKEDVVKQNGHFFKNILIMTSVIGYLGIPGSHDDWVGPSIEMATLAHSCLIQFHTQPLFLMKLIQILSQTELSAHFSIRVLSFACNTSCEDLMQQFGYLLEFVHLNSCLIICDESISLCHINMLYIRNDELFSKLMVTIKHSSFLHLFFQPSKHVCYFTTRCDLQFSLHF